MEPLYLVSVCLGRTPLDRAQAMSAGDVWVNAEWMAANGGDMPLVTIWVEPIDR